MTIELFFALCVITVITAIVGRTLKNREKRQQNQHKHLLVQWKNAHDKRKEWLADHPLTVNPFVDDEYEILWDREVGAEAFCVLAGTLYDYSSLEAYRREQLKYGAQKYE